MRRVSGRAQQWNTAVLPDNPPSDQSSRYTYDGDDRAAASNENGGGGDDGGDGRTWNNGLAVGIRAGDITQPPHGQERGDKMSARASRFGVSENARVGKGNDVSPGERKRGGESRRLPPRIRRFVFQKELALHVSMSILSIAVPFSLSGSPWLVSIPLSLWCFYTVMFVAGAKRAGIVSRRFDRFKRSFVTAMEEFLPRRLLPIFSLSFLSVVVAVALTAAKLGGSPLCVASCHSCLSSWANARPLSTDDPPDPNQACGFANGKELLAYYTVSQSAILVYLAVMAGLLTCLAWKVSEEELAGREAAEGRLMAQNPRAFELREQMILEHGRPGSSVRPELTRAWLIFGVVAASIFVLVGWRKWSELPMNAMTVVMIAADVTVTVTSVLMLHVGFHGRLIALYEGNLHRVHFLSKVLREGISGMEEPWVHVAEAWWSLRCFVLGEDLTLDYDVGGVGISATVAIIVVSFVVAIVQVVREGSDAILSPPGSYCAYATVYMTVSLVRILGLAAKTCLEQQLHAGCIEDYLKNLARVSSKASVSSGVSGRYGPSPSTLPQDQSSGLFSSQSSVGGEAVYSMSGHLNSAGETQKHPDSFSAEKEIGLVEGRRDKEAVGGVSNPGQESIKNMVVKIKTSDPCPCVLGIPIKPASFAKAKLCAYVFFAVISAKLVWDMIHGL